VFELIIVVFMIARFSAVPYIWNIYAEMEG